MNDIDNKIVMASNLKRLMEANHVDRNTICDKLDIKYSTFSEWLNAKKYPRIDKIELLANYFNCKKSDLIENNKSISYLYSDDEKQLIYKYRKIDDNGKMFIKSVLDREYQRCIAQYDVEKLIARGHESDEPVEVKIKTNIKPVPSDEEL